MNEAPFSNPGLSLPPYSHRKQHSNPLPPATVELLILLQLLLLQARHLRSMLEHAAARGLACIARCFGAAQVGFVLTNLSRGILRAIALQHVLQAQAGDQPAGYQPTGDQPAGGTCDPAACKRAAPAARHATSRRSRPGHDLLSALPSLRQLEAAIRGKPIEAVIGDISHDLGLSFSLCEARFGNALRDMVAMYRDTLANILHEFPRHDTAIACMRECNDDFALPPQKPGAIRYTVGLLFGAQQSVCGFPSTSAPPGAAIAGAHPP